MRVRALLALAFLAAQASAQESISVAVASNFVLTFTEIATAFQEKTGIRAMARAGSTGQLYAQIINGAPFDVFIAADAQRPAALEQTGHGVHGTRFTYALGRLVVWSKTADDCQAVLRDQSAGRVAIANPDVAPYGAAAREFLISIDAWSPELFVYGTNAMQARSFALTGNAVAAIIPRAHLTGIAEAAASCVYEVPQESHSPIEQQAILLGDSRAAARKFLEFLASEEARRIIEEQGYEVPE